MMSSKKFAARAVLSRGLLRLLTAAGGLGRGFGRGGQPRVSRPPGSVIYRFLDAVFSRRKVESIFSPIIADWQREYCAELFAGRRRQAKLLRVTYTWSLIKAAGFGRLYKVILSALERVKAI